MNCQEFTICSHNIALHPTIYFSAPPTRLTSARGSRLDKADLYIPPTNTASPDTMAQRKVLDLQRWLVFAYFSCGIPLHCSSNLTQDVQIQIYCITLLHLYNIYRNSAV